MIALKGVVKRFGAMTAVNDLSLTIETGAFAVLIGPSGCGKSTALRMINALLTPDAGTIAIDGRDVRETPPEQLRRGIGYAIQSVGLFPHWSVADNILALPRLLRWDVGRIKRRLDDIVALVGIDPALLPRRPHELSGGQQQRIGVARALAGDPAIVLMDEPFSALDPVSRANLQGEMVRIHKESGKTIVFVTHDMDEALALATQLFILDRGRLVQGGPPVRLLREPANDFVASFLGGTARHMRLLDQETVATRMRQGIADTADIEAAASLKTALDVMLAMGRNRLGVADATGRPIGTIDIQDIVAAPADD